MPHFFAETGMGMAHCGQSFVVTSGGGGTGFGIQAIYGTHHHEDGEGTIRKLMIVLMKFP